ncbi:permease prefix domain 1-containing protein [Microbacterium deminutum]|uniref:DUF4153 domain-containing protein n=1 Tax=Microbacterium deminutum TaxID=344164 RepID=A0ABN2Q642_9MICO
MTTGLEEQIGAWREFVRARAVMAGDVAELESHLRDQIEGLEASGLSSDEAFLVAVKRMGRLDDLSREFAREHSDRLWKQLVVGGSGAPDRVSTGLTLAVGLAIAAALAINLPKLFGFTLASNPDVYLRNAPVLVLPFLAAFFLIRRRARLATVIAVAAPFVVAGILLNVYPFASGGVTEVLAAIHAGVALWIVLGIAYINGNWRSDRARMDFIRFTGEWFVYFALLGLGGGVLIALTIGLFNAIGLDVMWFVDGWMLPCGVAGAVVIAGWLVEAKQSVIENIAPVLTKVFTPLFTLLLLALIAAGLVQGNVIDSQRDLLILFDITLVVVLGLLLYSMSARQPADPPSWFDRLQLLMVLAALAIDVLLLIAMIGRIGTYGASANKLASLGLNLILLANLAGAAWLQFGFVRGRVAFGRLERWQTSYVPVYLAWAIVVVVVFPPVFGFV